MSTSSFSTLSNGHKLSNGDRENGQNPAQISDLQTTIPEFSQLSNGHCENGHKPAQLRDALQISDQSPTNGPLINPLPLKDRVAIVTGGSGGIGSEICTHLASLGSKLVINYVGDPNPVNQLLSSLNSIKPKPEPGQRAIAVEADVSDPASVKLLFDRAEQTFGGPVHILVAAHGIQDPEYPAIAETTVETWDRVFNVNAKGTFLLAREAANRLVRGGGGRIVTMSSSTVGSLRPGYGSYSATKGAIEVMTRVLSKELKGTGITSNAVAPGPVKTAMFYAGKTEERIRALEEDNPMRRLGEPKDVASMVGFLVSDAAEWINGQIIRINGGYV